MFVIVYKHSILCIVLIMQMVGLVLGQSMMAVRKYHFVIYNAPFVRYYYEGFVVFLHVNYISY